MAASLATVARRFDFVRETEGPNKGTWVNLFQRFTGNDDGDSWCASFISYCLDICYRGHSPLKKSGAAQDLFAQAKANGWLVTAPAPDDVFFYVADGHAHHVGVVTQASPLTGFAGNTSEDGTSSNGTGAFEHALNPVACQFARLPQ